VYHSLLQLETLEFQTGFGVGLDDIKTEGSEFGIWGAPKPVPAPNAYPSPNLI